MTAHSLEVYHNKQLVFYSDAHWLHPLFELEAFLEKNEINAQELLLKDKIIGKAAALLIVGLDIKKVHAVLLSKLGQDILNQYQVSCTFDNLRERIACKTEDLLADVSNPNQAHQIIAARIAAQKA